MRNDIRLALHLESARMGAIAWSIAHQRWCYESSMHPIKLDRPGVTYHWCYEHEITGGRP